MWFFKIFSVYCHFGLFWFAMDKSVCVECFIFEDFPVSLCHFFAWHPLWLKSTELQAQLWAQTKTLKKHNNLHVDDIWRRWGTLYLALLTMRLPSRSQLTDGLGLPKAVQVKVILPPSLASTYCGGVSVKVGGAEESEDSKKFWEQPGTNRSVHNRKSTCT